jgi:hypothetical protein
MKAVLMSLHNRHILNMHSGDKTNELRTRPPKLKPPFKVYNLDTISSGGCGKVVSEWICDSMETWNKLFLGIPVLLMETGCVTKGEILDYTDNGNKALTAMHISNLVIYDKPKELGEFKYHCKYEFDDDFKHCDSCEYYYFSNTAMNGREEWCSCDGIKTLKRPPQSWQFVEELGV